LKYNSLIFFKGSAESHVIELFIDKECLAFKYNNEKDYLIPILQAEYTLGGEDNQFIVIKYDELTLFIKEIEILEELINSRYINNKEKLFKLQKSLKKNKFKKKFNFFSDIFFPYE